MIKRNRFWFKSLAIFMAINFLHLIIAPSLLKAQNTGPMAPEAASFESVDATDMVNLLTGDMSYVLPLMSVPGPEGGYPVTLSYHAGITLDQEASWVGLGWNINPGAINRGVNGFPDDWKNKRTYSIIHDEGSSTNITYATFGVQIPIQGISIGVGMNFKDGKANGGIVSFGVGTAVGDNNNSSATFGVSASSNGKMGASIGIQNTDKNSGLYGYGTSINSNGVLSVNNNIQGASIGISLKDGGSYGSFQAFSSLAPDNPIPYNKTDYTSIMKSNEDVNLSFWIFSYSQYTYSHTYWLHKELQKYASGTIYHDTGRNDAEFGWGAQSSHYATDVYDVPVDFA